MGLGLGSDIRLAERAGDVFEDIVRSGSLVVRRFSARRADEIGAHRLLDSPKVTPDGILAPFCARTAEACRGRRIVAAQDTTEINFSGADRSRRGLGLAGDGKSLGFFIHPVIAIDADDEAVLGIAGAKIWTRGMAKAKNHATRPLHEKESLCWLEGVGIAASVLETAASITVVGDRECDIFEVFAAERPANVQLLVRARSDRRLAGGGKLYASGDGFAQAGEMLVKVAPKGPGDRGRTARVAVSFGRVDLARPANLLADTANMASGKVPASLELSLVIAREINAPAGKEPLQWRLLTTAAVESFEDAVETIRFYRLRWRIEEVFRTLKKDGLALEQSQIETAPRLFNLAALGLAAAVRIIQLVDARDGGPRPATDVIDAAQIEPVAMIGASLEGKTERQKNPHPKASLAWMAWIAARLGGWHCYYKPPGPKTMADGWKRLATMLEAVKIIQTTQHV